jgi:hypothetical protein
MAIIEVVDFSLLAICNECHRDEGNVKVISAHVSKLVLTTNWLEVKL